MMAKKMATNQKVYAYSRLVETSAECKRADYCEEDLNTPCGIQARWAKDKPKVIS